MTGPEGGQASLDEDLLQAERDFANGDYVELTVEDLERYIDGGEWPFPDEPSIRSPPIVFR
jgi:hypothetical protein